MDYIELKDITPEDIDDQIKIRRELIDEMVGNLYPAIVQGEIDRLISMKEHENDFIKADEMDI